LERRDFLKLSSAFGVVALIKPAELLELKTVPVGIQLWSVRDAMEKDAKGTLKAIAGHGYKLVEPFGYRDGGWFGLPAHDFKSVVKDLGMKMPSCHYFLTSKNMDRKTGQMNDEFKQMVSAAKTIGNKYFVLPYMLPDEQNPETVKVLVEMMNRAGEYCKQAGLQFAYHNHAFEFQKQVDGKKMYEYILDNTDPKLVKMEMDMGWVHRANERPQTWMQKYPGRFPLSHMKDMESIEADTSTIIGNGIVDFREIIKNKKLAGMKHWIIEVEHYRVGSVADAGVCLQNLKKMLV
jgi:sugar phosphate isomerase/epimerase